MRYYQLLVILLLVLSGCKNESQSTESNTLEQNDKDLITMRGDFIYYEGAAVFQTPNTIYGVILDENAEELRQKVAPYKTNETDMVSVTLKAKRIPKAEGVEGWPFSIEIKEILKIEQPEPEAQDVIELSK